MEAEKVLHVIMKKLKEYKNNPEHLTVQDEVRQKTLMKLFQVYSTLRKKEQIKQKQKEQSTLQQVNENFHPSSIKHNDIPNQISENLEEYNKDFESNDFSENNSTTNFVDTENINESKEKELSIVEYKMNGDNLESEREYEIQLENTVTAHTPHNSNLKSEKIKHQNNKSVENNIHVFKIKQIPRFETYEKRKEHNKIAEIEQTVPVDGFLLRLGEGLKRLPYRKRAVIELEFLKRVYEVEKRLGLLDD